MTAPRALTLGLFLAWVATHVGVWALAPDVKTWARLFYVARSVEGVLLFFAVLAFAHWGGRVTVALFATCVLGMAAESVAAVCSTVFYAGGGVTPVYEVCEQTQAVTPWLLMAAAGILFATARSLSGE